MDATNDSPGPFFTPQGPAGGGGLGVQALASSPQAQLQAAPFGGEGPLPAGDARGGNEVLCRAGLRVEGGNLRPWDPLLPGGGQGEGGGLGYRQDFGGGGPLLGDRLWSDAEVRELWEVDAWQWMEVDADIAH